MSITPTAGSATAAMSGRWVSTAPTSSPPLLRPCSASCSRVVTPSATRRSATATKSSKTFCLFSQPASVVPGGAVLAAAAQVGHRQHAAGREPAEPLGPVRRQLGDVEAAVAPQQRRPRLVERHVGAAHQEVRHLGAVLARRARRRSVTTSGGCQPDGPGPVRASSALTSPLPRSSRYDARGSVSEDSPRNTSSCADLAVQRQHLARRARRPVLALDRRASTGSPAAGRRPGARRPARRRPASTCSSRCSGLRDHVDELERAGGRERVEVHAHQPPHRRLVVGEQVGRVTRRCGPGRSRRATSSTSLSGSPIELAPASVATGRSQSRFFSDVPSCRCAAEPPAVVRRASGRCRAGGRRGTPAPARRSSCGSPTRCRRSRPPGQRLGLGADAGARGLEVQVEVRRVVGQPGRLAELHLLDHVVDLAAVRQVEQPDRRPVAAAVADQVGQPAPVTARVAGRPARTCRPRRTCWGRAAAGSGGRSSSRVSPTNQTSCSWVPSLREAT